ncbi:hypothetical protein GCM10010912_32240 [Paenibacillus albidus]|uniref:Uncharacterized protein n=1 Tax=Paenibacillus albidus TaxID=2041023 RepID=A0A917CCY6_9BACL|nr:hypothetical protein [Paenibacillus albidus]GGF84606.1 hypothetical protein GCM10010912_32240 [Paenibacillus albidus]
MIQSMILLVAAGVAMAWELPRMVRKRYYRDIIVYCILSAAALWVCILSVSREDTPSPLEMLVFLYQPVNQWITSWF